MPGTGREGRRGRGPGLHAGKHGRRISYTGRVGKAMHARSWGRTVFVPGLRVGDEAEKGEGAQHCEGLASKCARVRFSQPPNSLELPSSNQGQKLLSSSRRGPTARAGVPSTSQRGVAAGSFRPYLSPEELARTRRRVP